MAAARTLRPATPQDAGALTALRSEYCHLAYKGYDPLCSLTDDQEFAKTLAAWMDDPLVRISLLALDGVPAAFAAFRLPGEEPAEILDLHYLPLATLTDLQALMDDLAKHITDAGAPYVQVWVLRDNLRARFHYQQLGFQPAGGALDKAVGGTLLRHTRYVLRLKDCPPGCL